MSDALAPWQAALVSLSASLAAAAPEDVAREATKALDDGASPEAVYETVLQCYLFVGFPRAIEGFFAARSALERRGFVARRASAPTAEQWTSWGERGHGLCRTVYGGHYEKLLATMEELSPDLASAMIFEGYGKTLSRPGLGPVEREYGVVGILTVTRMWRQLRSHALGAIHVGGTRGGVRAAIRCAAPYAGPEAIAEALRVTGLGEVDARS